MDPFAAGPPARKHQSVCAMAIKDRQLEVDLDGRWHRDLLPFVVLPQCSRAIDVTSELQPRSAGLPLL
jgi:hypothetical protein